VSVDKVFIGFLCSLLSGVPYERFSNTPEFQENSFSNLILY
jgi:hypothetical protein